MYNYVPHPHIEALNHECFNLKLQKNRPQTSAATRNQKGNVLQTKPQVKCIF